MTTEKEQEVRRRGKSFPFCCLKKIDGCRRWKKLRKQKEKRNHRFGVFFVFWLRGYYNIFWSFLYYLFTKKENEKIKMKSKQIALPPLCSLSIFFLPLFVPLSAFCLFVHLLQVRRAGVRTWRYGGDGACARVEAWHVRESEETSAAAPEKP